MGSNPIFSEVYDTLFFFGDVLQLAECMLCKHKVTGSNPVISIAFVAQLAEHSYGKGKVPGSNPAVGCKNNIIMHIQLVFKSYERLLLNKASTLLFFLGDKISMRTQENLQPSVKYLPTHFKKYTLLKSPHIDKKSREQIEMRTYKMSMQFGQIQNSKVFLMFLELIKIMKLEGVQLKCTFKSKTTL
jgi:ribosomal protein S10